MKADRIFDELKKTDIVSDIELVGFKKFRKAEGNANQCGYGDKDECGPNECNCDCQGPLADDCDCDCH